MPKGLPALCLTPLRSSSIEVVGLVVHSGVFLSLPEIQTLTFLILCFQNENPKLLGFESHIEKQAFRALRSSMS